MSYKLQATSKYSLFTIAEFNRDISKIKPLMESMKKHGFIPAYPIHCCRSAGGKLTIKAGHHRFEAAKRLGIPIFYVVCEDAATIHELETAGAGQWKPADYLTSFVRCGFDPYLKVQDYIQRTGISLQLSIGMLGGHSAGSSAFTKAFKQGLYKVADDTAHAETVGRIVVRLKEAGIDFANNFYLVKAVSHVAHVAEFDADQFIHRVKVNIGMFQKQPHAQGYVTLIDTIYNRHSQIKVPLAFLADQVAKERCPVGVKKASYPNQPTEGSQ